MFYDTRQKKSKLLSCVIHIIIRNYVCIDYLGSERNFLSELRLGSGGSYKHANKNYDNVLGIGIPYLLMNFMSCHGFLKNKDSVVILKCPNRIFEYYLSKGFIHLDCNKINLEKLPSEVKDRIVAEVTYN